MRSSCGKTATVCAPSSVAARNARTAISPRLATSTLRNTVCLRWAQGETADRDHPTEPPISRDPDPDIRNAGRLHRSGGGRAEHRTHGRYSCAMEPSGLPRRGALVLERGWKGEAHAGVRHGRSGRSPGGARAAAGRLPADTGGSAGAAGQADLQPLPPPRGARRPRPRRQRARPRPLGRPRAARRPGAGDDHLRAARRRDPVGRDDAPGRPAAQDHHHRWGGHRARHRVLVLPQRPAARVGPRDGDPHRGR